MSENESKARRRLARSRVVKYHEAELAGLLEHVRGGFERYAAGEIDAFELDDIIHRYQRATRKLSVTCVGGGLQIEQLARTLESNEASGLEIDWWALATPRHRGSDGSDLSRCDGENGARRPSDGASGCDGA